jgi:hypothetical protein
MALLRGSHDAAAVWHVGAVTREVAGGGAVPVSPKKPVLKASVTKRLKLYDIEICFQVLLQMSTCAAIPRFRFRTVTARASASVCESA